MKHYILQLDAIAKFSELLSLRHENYALWVSNVFFQESNVDSSNTPFKSINTCLIQAELKGHVRKYSSRLPKPVDGFYGYRFSRFYNWNSVVSAFETELKRTNPDEEIFIVCPYETSGKTLSAKQLFEQMKRDKAIQDPEILALAKEVKSEKWFLSVGLSLLFGSFIVVPAAFSRVLEYIKADSLLGIMLVFLIFLIMWFLFRLRRRRRIQYGMIELFVGLISIGKSLANYFSVSRPLSAIEFIAVLSGIYIVIRGLDNIETGMKLKNMTNYLKWWERVF